MSQLEAPEDRSAAAFEVTTPSASRGARSRQDIRPRVLAALTLEPSTATEIAERARLPGRERAAQANRALIRLEVNGLAVRGGTPQVPRWTAAAGPTFARFEPGREA